MFRRIFLEFPQFILLIGFLYAKKHTIFCGFSENDWPILKASNVLLSSRPKISDYATSVLKITKKKQLKPLRYFAIYYTSQFSNVIAFQEMGRIFNKNRLEVLVAFKKK